MLLPDAGARLKRGVIFVHRWLGVALCLLFAVWYLSGIAMMYARFPEVTPADRLARLPALDPARVRLSPADARTALGDAAPAGLPTLTTVNGRPAYRFGGPLDLVYADTGERFGVVTAAFRLEAAASWAGQPAADAAVQRIEEPDQWTLQGELSEGVLWKYAWPSGDQVYVSVSGDVVQHTTSRTRLAAYLGPIPHWFYFTPLRSDGATWARVVVWSSGAGTVSAILGMIIALWIYSPSKRYRRDGVPAAFPYRGQKRWHLWLGLIFGSTTITWAFSGMLSMDPFPRQDVIESAAHPGHDIPYVLRSSGVELSAFDARPPREALSLVSSLAVKEMELTAVDGDPIYIALLNDGRSHVIPVIGEPRDTLGSRHIMDIVRRTAGPEGIVRLYEITQYDRYYRDRRRERPLPVVVVQLTDRQDTRYYIDPATAQVLETYQSSDWQTRWLYQGLHRLDFPWLYNYRPLWDIVVLTGLLGGAALSVTSLVLAWRALGRALSARIELSGRPRERAS